MKTINVMKKYNSQTDGFKIDIYACGCYFASTDIHRTLKSAKKRMLYLHPEYTEKEIVCKFSTY